MRLAMVPVPEFDHADPKTVFDILWSWSTGYLTTDQAVQLMELENEMELYEACLNSDVPFPGTPSKEDVRMADEFLDAITIAP